MKKDVMVAYAWIMRGNQRPAIVKAINGTMTPKQIAEQTNLKFSNVSDNLSLMIKNGIVKCLNPEDKKGRLYTLTSKGMKVKEECVKYGK